MSNPTSTNDNDENGDVNDSFNNITLIMNRINDILNPPSSNTKENKDNDDNDDNDDLWNDDKEIDEDVQNFDDDEDDTQTGDWDADEKNVVGDMDEIYDILTARKMEVDKQINKPNPLFQPVTRECFKCHMKTDAYLLHKETVDFPICLNCYSQNPMAYDSKSHLETDSKPTVILQSQKEFGSQMSERQQLFSSYFNYSQTCKDPSHLFVNSKGRPIQCYDCFIDQRYFWCACQNLLPLSQQSSQPNVCIVCINNQTCCRCNRKINPKYECMYSDGRCKTCSEKICCKICEREVVDRVEKQQCELCYYESLL